MTRKIRIALLVGVVVLATTWICIEVFARRSAPFEQERLNVMATVNPDTEFRLYRRLPKNNYWDDGSPFPRVDALAVVDAIDSAKPWDRISHAAVIGQYHAYTPGYTLCLSWCKDMKDDTQREKGSVAICYGNWLFDYGNTDYQLSEEGHEVFNRVFSENK